MKRVLRPEADLRMGNKDAFAALLFDMDGTLVDSRAAVERLWLRWAARRGLDFERILATAHGRRTRDTVRLFCPPGVDPEAEADGLIESEERDTEGIVPVAGAHELLSRLPPDRWAIVTSANAALAHTRLAAAGLPVPPVLVPAGAVIRGKPDPEGYLLAADLLGVAARDCLVFEDAIAGIEAARAAGASVLVVTDAQPHALATGEATIPNFNAIDLTVHESGLRVELL